MYDATVGRSEEYILRLGQAELRIGDARVETAVSMLALHLDARRRVIPLVSDTLTRRRIDDPDSVHVATGSLRLSADSSAPVGRTFEG